MDTSMPIVSVITLTYNNFEKLADTVESVLTQDYSHIEYIISDDGSQSFPDEMINNLLSQNHLIRFQVIKHPNVGTVRNKNIALKESHGMYIVPLSGGDSFVSPDVVSNIVKKFQETDADIVTAKSVFRDKNTGDLRIHPPEKRTKLLQSNDRKRLFYELCVSSFISGSCTYYSRRVLEKYGGFNEEYKLIEDFPFYTQFILDGGKIHFLDMVTINYDTNGITSKKRGVSQLLVRDRKLYYKKIIWPNIGKISHIQKQELRFRYYQMCGSRIPVLYFMQLITCIDFIFVKLIRKLIK